VSEDGEEEDGQVVVMGGRRNDSGESEHHATFLSAQLGIDQGVKYF
jgi:hypothetical protein